MTERNVFTDMRDKDPVLFGSLEHIPIAEVVGRWKERYPDDFPKGGNTAVDDPDAVRPQPHLTSAAISSVGR